MKTSKARALLLGVIAVAAVSVAVGFKTQGEMALGAKVPAFSAKGTDGKTHTLASLTKNGPVVLYFISDTCPVNTKAAPYVAKMSAAYKNKGQLVGIIDGDLTVAKAWQKRFGASFTLVEDPDMKIIRSYKAPHSPYFMVVDKGGKVAKIIDGSSAGNLKTVSTVVAKTAKMPLATVSFKGAPEGAG